MLKKRHKVYRLYKTLQGIKARAEQTATTSAKDKMLEETQSGQHYARNHAQA